MPFPAIRDNDDHAPQAGWRARLDLRFAFSHGQTRLVARRHEGPLMVQRPFHPESDGTCHVYLLHPPGGVAGGDRLAVAIEVGADARALLTTPAATKFYRSAGAENAQTCSIVVKERAGCEYLPQETILFDGTQARLDTEVTLAEDASFTGWEILCLGRPAAGESFAAGRVVQRIAIRRGSRPVWTERMALRAGSAAQHAAYGLAGRTVIASMVHVGSRGEPAAEAIRQATAGRGEGVFSVSELEEAIVCRYLGHHADEAKSLFTLAWNVLRAERQGKPAVAPRIWAT